MNIIKSTLIIGLSSIASLSLASGITFKCPATASILQKQMLENTGKAKSSPQDGFMPYKTQGYTFNALYQDVSVDNKGKLLSTNISKSSMITCDYSTSDPLGYAARLVILATGTKAKNDPNWATPPNSSFSGSCEGSECAVYNVIPVIKTKN